MAALGAVPGSGFAGRLLGAALFAELAGVADVAALRAGPCPGSGGGLLGRLRLLRFPLLVVILTGHDILDDLASLLPQTFQDALPGGDAACKHQGDND